MNYFSKYIIVGVINTLIGYCLIFSLMYLMKCSPEISNVIGYGVGLLFSYCLNRIYTFKSNKIKYKEFMRFFIVFLLSYMANFLVLVLLTYKFKVFSGLSQLLAGIVYISFSFFLNRYYVFATTAVYKK